jgi:hypothetical protein
MNTSVEPTEKNTVLEDVKKNTASGSLYNSQYVQESARRRAEQFYKDWLNSNLAKDRELYEIAELLADPDLYSEVESLASHVCSGLLLMLEKRGQLKPALLGGYSTDALAKLGEIILTPGQLPRLEQEEEEEPAIVIPDEYFVEGIRMDWKSTFKFHEKLNKLREKYGIRRI